MTGSKESLENPFPPGSTGYERICFTDDPDLKSDHWSIVPLEPHGLEPERESRRPKILAHRFLPEFDWSLYVDSTVRLHVDPIQILRQYGRTRSSLVCFEHPWRNCIYAEAEEVIRLGFDDERRVREQMDYYRACGYPRQAGLIAGAMLLRRHNDARLVGVHEEWYDHVLRFSRRDQLSFNFVAWRRRFRYSAFDGSLTHNAIMEGPVAGQGIRIPQDFRDHVYAWLNPEVFRSELSPREHYLSIGAEHQLRYTVHRWELDRLANKHRTDKGNLYFNAHGYSAIYEHYLRHQREAAITLLELGLLRHDVQARNPGGSYDDLPSLRMWREYFPNAAIIGFDVADFTQAPPMPNVTIMQGDVGNRDDLAALVKRVGAAFDVIIDDASHASHHQQIALACLFPHVKAGGYYFIEDLRYQPPDLEISGTPTTLELLKALDAGTKAPYTPYIPSEQLEAIRDSIEFIEFHDSQDRQFGDIGTDAFAVIKKLSSRNARSR